MIREMEKCGTIIVALLNNKPAEKCLEKNL